MHRYQILDEVIVAVKGRPEKTLSAALYGKGIFTTVAVDDRQPFQWEKHWRRLASNAEKLCIDLSEHPENKTLGLLRELIAANAVERGRARITFSDESPSPVWSEGSEKNTSLSILTAGPRQLPEYVKLTISPHLLNSTSPLAGIKSCNYLDPLMAFEEARERGFAEAVRLNERGEIASACLANIFWMRAGKLFTPSLNSGCLAGTTRELILEKLECEEVEARITDLENADQIFLTSAGVGVVRVATFQDRRLEDGDAPILSLVPKSH